MIYRLEFDNGDTIYVSSKINLEHSLDTNGIVSVKEAAKINDVWVEGVDTWIKMARVRRFVVVKDDKN